MSPVELGVGYKIDSKLVVGSASVETIFKLASGQSHEADATLSVYPVEETFGGSGICNAVASANTGVLERIVFMTVAGTQNGNPDPAARSIERYLKEHDIQPQLQLHEGLTEQSWIILSGHERDQKRGFRPVQEQGLLRDKFEVTNGVIDEASKHPLLVTSSFPAEKVVQLAQEYRNSRGPNNSLLVWTVNRDSAQQIEHDPEVQSAIKEGIVDMMFMSQKEYAAITQSRAALQALDHIDTIIVTKGAGGCYVRSHLKNTSFEYTVPSFDTVDSVVNDNGAGETHHNNFLATVTSVQDRLDPDTDLKYKMSVIETAAQIGNLAAFIKIQQPYSLWFPQLNFRIVRQLLDTDLQHTPADITALVYEDYQQNHE